MYHRDVFCDTLCFISSDFRRALGLSFNVEHLYSYSLHNVLTVINTNHQNHMDNNAYCLSLSLILHYLALNNNLESENLTWQSYLVWK